MMSRSFNSGSRPKLACEIAADRVLAGRLSENGHTVEVCATEELASGSVVPDLLEANLRQKEAVYQAVREALESVGGRSRDVVAVLPDAAVRVVLLDFDTLPDNRDEAESVVRFRLKKSLPFDTDKAKVSYHAQPSRTGVRVIAAVALSSVVEDYEAVFREAGYNPGVVMPSMLAALGAADAGRPTLVIKVDARTTSIAILDQQQLLLFRTLENTRGTNITGEQLAEEVYPSVVFFQDTYHLNIGQIFERDRERTNAERLLNLPENRSIRDRSQFVNELFQRKSFSWTRVFEDLERVMPPRLHVVSIRPALAPENQLEIKLVVAGDSSDRALQLVRRMESSQRFQQTLIEQWRNQQSQGPGDAVQFDITALYVPEPGTKAETKRSTP